jgi:hypothetical protein
MQLYAWTVQFENALPYEGGVLDQPALVMEALGTVRDEYHKVEKWREHEEKVKGKQEADRNKRARDRSSR